MADGRAFFTVCPSSALFVSAFLGQTPYLSIKYLVFIYPPAIFCLWPSSILSLSMPYRGRFHIQQIHLSSLYLSSNPPLFFLLRTSSTTWTTLLLQPPRCSLSLHSWHLLSLTAKSWLSSRCYNCTLFVAVTSNSHDYLSELIIRPDMRIRLSPSQNLSVNCPACSPESSSKRWGVF